MACNGLGIRHTKLGEQQLTRVQILRRQLTLDLGLGLGAFISSLAQPFTHLDAAVAVSKLPAAILPLAVAPRV